MSANRACSTRSPEAPLAGADLQHAGAHPDLELNILQGQTDLLYLVDMPGYGYARASKTAIKQWTALIFDYLRGRATLSRVFLLIDARHGIKPADTEVMRQLDEAAVSYQVVFTKTDKVSADDLAELTTRTSRGTAVDMARPIPILSPHPRGSVPDWLNSAPQSRHWWRNEHPPRCANWSCGLRSGRGFVTMLAAMSGLAAISGTRCNFWGAHHMTVSIDSACEAASEISSIDQARVLAQALPYMQRYTNETVVIKYGGHAMGEEHIAALFAQDVALLKQAGVRPVVVHGGGPQIGAMLERLGIQTRFDSGLRVTDKQTVEVVEMVLAGSINKQIVTEINKAGGRAVGLSGKDGSMILARKLKAHHDRSGFQHRAHFGSGICR